MSHIPRLYVPDPLQTGAPFALPEAQSKYLLRVMRLTDGAKVRVFNGMDGEWQCLLQTRGKTAELAPESQLRPQTPTPALKLLFAPIKKARTDFIIEKATELGVSEIQPVFTDYTQNSRIRPDRLHTLAIEAAEQTERMDLPEIHDGVPLSKAISECDPDVPLIYCDEGGDAAPLPSFQSRLENQKGVILIGPEGGFSPNERKMLRSLDFVIPITLGPRILRAETAVVSALTLWQSQVGDWQNPPYLPEM